MARGRRALRRAAPGAQRPRPVTWRQYAVAPGRPWSWSTRTATWSPGRRRGAGRRAGRLIDELVGRVRRPAAPRRRARTAAGAGAGRTLRFPGQGDRGTPAGTLLVADAGHHQLVELARRRDGAAPDRLGRAGPGDGGPDAAAFAEPNGLAVLPADVGRRGGRAGRRHRQPPAARACGWTTATVTHGGRPAARRWPAPGRSPARCRRALALGRGLVGRADRGRGGRRAPAAGVDPAPTRSRCWPAPPSRGCGTGRRWTAGWPSRPGWRRGRRPALVRRLRDLGAALR